MKVTAKRTGAHALPAALKTVPPAATKSAHEYFTPEALEAICRMLDPFEGANGEGRFVVGNALEILSEELILLCAGIANDRECRDFDMIEKTLSGIQLRVLTLSKVAKQVAGGAE